MKRTLIIITSGNVRSSRKSTRNNEDRRAYSTKTNFIQNKHAEVKKSDSFREAKIMILLRSCSYKNSNIPKVNDFVSMLNTGFSNK